MYNSTAASYVVNSNEFLRYVHRKQREVCFFVSLFIWPCLYVCSRYPECSIETLQEEEEDRNLITVLHVRGEGEAESAAGISDTQVSS